MWAQARATAYKQWTPCNAAHLQPTQYSNAVPLHPLHHFLTIYLHDFPLTFSSFPLFPFVSFSYFSFPCISSLVNGWSSLALSNIGLIFCFANAVFTQVIYSSHKSVHSLWSDFPLRNFSEYHALKHSSYLVFAGVHSGAKDTDMLLPIPSRHWVEWSHQWCLFLQAVLGCRCLDLLVCGSVPLLNA